MLMLLTRSGGAALSEITVFLAGAPVSCRVVDISVPREDSGAVTPDGQAGRGEVRKPLGRWHQHQESPTGSGLPSPWIPW
ncbi:uncharacterized protein [Heliangelus exortis]|uniref:uncharacterized protein isoform X2 n=1 Tax=Heliangelus exortis TaxID=472823 RepID=UPI003A8F1978